MWPKQADIRRLIVPATHPNGNVIQVSILTNDVNRCELKVIELMFNRWLQENDFKYLDKHFGINELTSYASFSYKDLEKTIDDKRHQGRKQQQAEKSPGEWKLHGQQRPDDQKRQDEKEGESGKFPPFDG